jgi:uncharacterized protein
VLVVFTALSGFFVDILWYREVDFSQVFWKVLWTKALLGLLFGAAFFGILYVNLLIVRNTTPRYRAMTPQQEILERYRLALEPYAWWLIPLVAAVIAAFVGYGVTTRWQTFLLWQNSGGVTFGPENLDPQFHRDPAFYVFRLPWFRFVQGWLFSALVGVTFITAAAHYLWGGIRPQAPGLVDKVSPQVKAHLSVLLGLIVLTKAWGYYLGQFSLVVSPRGIVAGATYTDVNAHLPALRILTVIAVVCAILFLVNIRMRGWALPVAAVGLLVLVSITAGALYPAFVQRFRVDPQEPQLEQPYIERNITATRAAFDLTDVQLQPRTVEPAVSAEGIANNASTIANIRVWRPAILQANFENLQRIRQYYEVRDVDVDRYLVEDERGVAERRVLMVSAREVAQAGIPGGGATWQNQHLIYTHGYGAIAAQVNTATTEGAPVFVLEDIPPTGPLATELPQPRVYFGEEHQVDYVIVGTKAQELDYQLEGQAEQVTTEYSGRGGIEIGGLVRRALFAWRFRDVNLLISGVIDGDSRIMIYQDIIERVPRAAPFLRFDGDPYAAIVDGRIKWIWDAYTTSDQYPYSQPLEMSDVASQTTADIPALSGTVNYIRNSVKVVVDAYDGTIKYYLADPDDPIALAWRNAFPNLFTPMDQASDDLRAHFRYPENLFQVQAAHFVNYHVTDPNVFYQKQEFWQVPEDPTQDDGDDETGGAAIRPYYLLMRLPGEEEENFVLVMPFTPAERPNMVGWMAAHSDPLNYGQLLSFEFPPGASIDGPSQAFARINQDPQFSSERTLLSQAGSDVLFGDLLVIPIGDAFLYVVPMYVQSVRGAIPELTRVVVVNGGVVGLGNTIQEAIADSLGQAPPPPPGGEEPPTGGGNVREQVAALIAQALGHFDAAQTALREGDLATYEDEIEDAQAAIEEAAALAGRSGQALPPTSPTPPPTPSVTPTPTG